MIKFFRHIRRSLIQKNEMGKYFKYAIGEIILVMIGILLALQVNNWNENRKLHQIEHETLADIKDDLLETKNHLLENRKNHNRQIKQYKSLLKNIEDTRIYHDSLDTYYGQLVYWVSPYLTTASYDNLKSDKGVNLISNDSLRHKIIKLHEETFKTLIGDVEREEWINTETSTRPFVLKHFDVLGRKVFKPKNYDKLINDSEFKNILMFTLGHREQSLWLTNLSLEKIEDVLSSIEKELQ